MGLDEKMTLRADGRSRDQVRPLRMVPGYTRHAEGSVLIEMGDTRVLCTASVEEKVPGFLKDTGRGWVTAEYGMLPRATHTRSDREASKGKQGGRTHEIQRLIGRSLRSVTRLEELGERAIWIDCDVLQADGGTRTASITGAYVALVLAVRSLQAKGLLAGPSPIHGAVAAVSAGIVGGLPVVDLAYEEDSRAEVDMNFVMTDDGRFVEIQGTAEGQPFTRAQADTLADMAWAAIRELLAAQRAVLDAVG